MPIAWFGTRINFVSHYLASNAWPHTTRVDTGDGETTSSGLATAESDTQDIEADRACLDQVIALLADHRDFDSMPTAGQVSKLDCHAVTAKDFLAVLAIDFQCNSVTRHEFRLK
jgi:hypothetical protein